MNTPDLERSVINCIRALSMDAVQKASSGHPGTPVSLAPVAFKLWDRFITHNPANPDWANRDRFVLSAGHASMLLYSILHIYGYDVDLEEIKEFRQLHSRCAGHPEFGLIPGIETTTGPLGQGAAVSVGMGIAEKWLASYFNRPGHEIINYRIYSILSDGDVMEGITSEAASLAGHLGLGNVIWIYDNNKVTIEGETSLAFSEDVVKRFQSYNWHTQSVDDANDLQKLDRAIELARDETDRPSLVVIDSQIAYGSPNKQGRCEAHGAPLGEEEVALTKQFYGLNPDEVFQVTDEVRLYRDKVLDAGHRQQQIWDRSFDEYSSKYSQLAHEFELIQKRELPEGWDDEIPVFPPDEKGTATRKSNNRIMKAVSKRIKWMLGGASDVGSSTNTLIDEFTSNSKKDPGGRNLHFGIREHAMAAVANGMALSRLIPYASTYFIFSDYLKPALRLSALMNLQVIYIFTHDSIFLGEDGPTHQPVEHLASLRAIPNIDVIRPADANELSVLWKHAVKTKTRPVVFVLTRQNVPVIDRKRYRSAEGALKGGYIIADSDERPEIIIISTGSEVNLCLGVHERLKEEGIPSRVVSLPCWDIFERQSERYKETVLPSDISKRLSVEAASTFGWERYVGSSGQGRAFGIDRFGESAPCSDLMNEFGFTVDDLYREAKEVISDEPST